MVHRLHFFPSRRQLEETRGSAMKALDLSFWAVAATFVLGFAMHATAQDPQINRVIVVSLEDRKLALVEDGQVKKIYTVSVGRPSTPSPVGTFKIRRRVANPVYQHDGKTVQPGPGNPVGTRWMGLSIPGYGIHGTNVSRSIGKAASHGCIRMGKADLEELYELVAVGDPVELIGQRNEETAALFDATPAAPRQQPAVLAQVAPAAEPAPAPAKADLPVPAAIAAAGSR
jgi:lipoprotein-anchoring transpeptidase ErfK/SrfK